jgi:hypothetical protein
MPTYFAGYVNANATLKPSYGSGFSVSRWLAAGSYRVTLAAGTFSKFVIPVVSPVAAHTYARVVQAFKDPLTGIYTMEVEIHDVTTDAYVNSDFTFIAVERSGP